MRTEPGFFEGCPDPQQEAMGTNWSAGGFLLSTRQLCCAMQVTEPWHRLPRRSLLGDLQNSTAHGPGHPALGVPAGARIGPDGPKEFFPSLCRSLHALAFCFYPSVVAAGRVCSYALNRIISVTLPMA